MLPCGEAAPGGDCAIFLERFPCILAHPSLVAQKLKLFFGEVFGCDYGRSQPLTAQLCKPGDANAFGQRFVGQVRSVLLDDGVFEFLKECFQ